jgi:hypothetical protein
MGSTRFVDEGLMMYSLFLGSQFLGNGGNGFGQLIKHHVQLTAAAATFSSLAFHGIYMVP